MVPGYVGETYRNEQTAGSTQQTGVEGWRSEVGGQKEQSSDLGEEPVVRLRPTGLTFLGIVLIAWHAWCL